MDGGCRSAMPPGGCSCPGCSHTGCCPDAGYRDAAYPGCWHTGCCPDAPHRGADDAAGASGEAAGAAEAAEAAGAAGAASVVGAATAGEAGASATGAGTGAGVGACAGRAGVLGAAASAGFAGAVMPAAASAAFSLRATGGSMLEEGPLTYSPISLSFSRATLLSIPSSAATSCTRGFAATILLSGSAPGQGQTISYGRVSFRAAH
jgi:hypothetical protein